MPITVQTRPMIHRHLRTNVEAFYTIITRRNPQNPIPINKSPAKHCTWISRRANPSQIGVSPGLTKEQVARQDIEKQGRCAHARGHDDQRMPAKERAAVLA